MSEKAPVYGAKIDRALPEVDLLCRVFGLPRDEVLQRVIEAGIDAVLEEDQVAEIVARLRKLDERRAGKRPGPVAAQAAPAPASAEATSRPVRVAAVAQAAEPEPADELVDEVPQKRAPETNGAAPVVTTAERARAASHIKTARMRRGLSQQEVAYELGISNGTVSLAERAGVHVAAETLKGARGVGLVDGEGMNRRRSGERRLCLADTVIPAGAGER